MKENLPEIVFATSEPAESQRNSRLLRAGRLRKISPRVYTSNLADGPESIVARNLYQILGRLFPGAVLSHRTALEAKPTEDGAVFLTYKYTRRIPIPGVTVHLLKGEGRMEDDMPFLDGLFISSRPRAYLENLQTSRSRSSSAKALSKSAVEDGLDRLCQVQGEKALNALRDRARVIAPALGMQAQFQGLNKIIGTILRSRPAKGLDSKSARARSRGVPYDTARLAILNGLFSHLLRSPQPARVDKNRTSDKVRLLAFFESYFSNYIEGTEFEIAEAYNIVFKNKIPVQRPADAHDILGTFRIVSSSEDRCRTPTSFDEFLALLQSRHHAMMEGRPDKFPGQFKSEPNRAGQTHFVSPELVKGTLLKGFDLAMAVEPGLARAVYMMFLVAEVHPFVDGNGRVARAMMNAELTHAGLCRIIVPTVLRDDYLLGLRAMSRSDNPDPIIKVMDYAQQLVSELPLTSYKFATEVLTQCHAFDESDEGRLRLPGSLSVGLAHADTDNLGRSSG
jgi:fido (protein-threonine AMPylation protein)